MKAISQFRVLITSVFLLLICAQSPAFCKEIEWKSLTEKPSLGDAFGSKKNRESDVTKALQEAIDACHKAGGGTVVVPAGDYVIRPIFLKSNTTLKVDAGTTLRGTPEPEHYRRDNRSLALINGNGAKNIAITGHGTIDGQGGKYWWGKPAGRPRLLSLIDCENVLLEDITLRESPGWTTWFAGLKKVIIRGITIENPLRSPNTDGIVLGDAHDVQMSDCTISTGDDCVTIKGPARNINISNCNFRSGWAAFRVVGGAKNITITNSTFQCETVFKINGTISEVVLSNSVVNGGRLLLINPQEIKEHWKDYVGPVKNIMFTNIVAYDMLQLGGGFGSEGLPVSDIFLNNVEVTSKSVEGEKFPELSDFFYFGFIKNLNLKDVHIRGMISGPSLICENINGLSIDGFKSSDVDTDNPLIKLNQVKGAQVIHSLGKPEQVFIQISGEKTESIHLAHNYIDRSTLLAGPEVPEKALEMVSVKFADLRLPQSIHANESYFVSAKISNETQENGFAKVQLFVDETLAKEKYVWLNDSEIKTVQIPGPVLFEPETYTFSIETLKQKARVVPKPATIEYSNFQISSDLIRFGDDVLTSAQVKNIGSYTGDEKVILFLNDQAMAEKNVDILPGQQTRVEFKLTPEIHHNRIRIGTLGNMPLKVYQNSLESTYLELDFEELSNDQVLDKSGLQNHARLKTNSGGDKPILREGIFGNAIVFNGSSAFCEIPGMLLKFPMTISLWIKPGKLTETSVGGKHLYLYFSEKGGSDGFGAEIETHLSREAVNRIGFFSELPTPFNISGPIEDVDDWIFVTAVFDENTRLYLNGKEVARRSGVKKPDLSLYDDVTYLGRPKVDYIRYFPGEMDEVKLFTEPLSGEQILQLYMNYKK